MLILDAVGGLLSLGLSFGFSTCCNCLWVVKQRFELVVHRIRQQVARKTLNKCMVDTLLLLWGEWFPIFWELLDLIELLLIQELLLLLIFSRYLFLLPVYLHLQVALLLKFIIWQVLVQFAELFDFDAVKQLKLLMHNLHRLKRCCDGECIFIIVLIPWFYLMILDVCNIWWQRMSGNKLAAKSSWSHFCEAACEGTWSISLVLIAWRILIFNHCQLRLRFIQFFLRLIWFVFWAAYVDVLSIFNDILCVLLDVDEVITSLWRSQELVDLLTFRWRKVLSGWLTFEAQEVIGVIIDVNHVFFYDDLVLNLRRPSFILSKFILRRSNRLRALVSWRLQHLKPPGVFSLCWVYLFNQLIHLQQVLDNNWLIHNFDVLLWFIHVRAQYLNLAALSIQINVDDHSGWLIFGNPFSCQLSVRLAWARHSFFLGLWSSLC